MENEINVYVACLAAYNSGYLHGKWIDANQSADEIYSEVSEMLSESPIAGAEEWAIHDYEGFGELRLSEWESFAEISKIACIISNYGDLAIELLKEYACNADEAEKILTENYIGIYDSEEDYTYKLTQEQFNVPFYLDYYIDYKLMAHDLERDSDVIFIRVGNATHVFHW